MSLEVHADLGPCSRRHMDIGDCSPGEDLSSIYVNKWPLKPWE